MTRVAALTLLLLLGGASSAAAHGLVIPSDLPLPDWMFVAGSGLVVAISFAAIALLWRTPRMQEPSFRPLPARVGRVATSRMTEVILGVIGVGGLVLVIVAGLAGTPDGGENIAPNMVFVVFWLGLVPLSLLFGDVFRMLNPWRAVGRVVGALVGSGDTEPLPYPRWLGHWPAALGILGFTAHELVLVEGRSPSTLAWATIGYSIATWIGMGIYGVEAWSRRGEAFGVYFGLFARMAPLARRGRDIGVRRPLEGLLGVEVLAGTIALLAVMIGSVSFDGASGGSGWQSVIPALSDVYSGLDPRRRIEMVFLTGLLGAVLATAAFYLLGAWAAARSTRERTWTVARAFVSSLVPIAVAYVGAHYVSLLLIRGQEFFRLVSDPLGKGWDVFGTSDWTIDVTPVSFEVFWYLQIALVVLGHCAGLLIAHERALQRTADPVAARHSQYPLAAVMIGFTSLALWLLTQVRDS